MEAPNQWIRSHGRVIDNWKGFYITILDLGTVVCASPVIGIKVLGQETK